MLKDKEFILHLIGLIVLTCLAVFFAVLQALYKIEVTDVGMILGGIMGLAGVHGASAISKLKQGDKNDETPE